MKRTAIALTLFVVVATVPIFIGARAQQAPPATGQTYRGWAAYGGGPEQIRYSRLNQINRGNVKQLEQAWIYDSGETGGLQTQPIVVDGVLYGVTPSHKVFAVRAATGEHLWTFDSGLKAQGPNRGLMYWSDGRDDKRVYAAVTRYVYALDVRTGKPIPTFGDGGRIDLHKDLGRDPERQSVVLTTPGVVHKDLLILGGRVSEGLPASPGDIRAYNARTGAAAVELPHDSASRRSRLRDVVEGVVARERRRQQLAGHGARRGARDRLRPDGVGGGRLLRRQPARRQPVRELPAGAQRRHRKAHLALPVRAARHLGSRLRRRRRASSRSGRTARRSTPLRRPPNTATSSCSIARTACRSFRSSTASSRRATCPVRWPADAQPIPTRPAPFARQALTARHGDLSNAGGTRVGARRAREVQQRRTVRAALGRQADGRLPRLRRRGRVGRPGVRSRHGLLLCQRQRSRVDRGTGAGGRGRHGARPLPAELRRLPPRRSAGRAAADRVARRHRAAKNER